MSTTGSGPSRIWFGGDYNPEQWPRSIWPDDIALMKQASVSLVTVGVFSWAHLEPTEGDFDFGWLDEVLDLLYAAGIRVDLATATASPPPWLTHAYPEILPMTKSGVRMSPGSRQGFCPSSPIYRGKAQQLVRALAERYGSHPALEMWHINNELGGSNGRCYCDVSAEAFRTWLRAKYGTVEELNFRWGTAFWSQRYSSFAEVLPPRSAPTFKNPTQLLDFERFSSDELLECYRGELAILRAATPDTAVTTNFMGFFKGADYWSWASEIDVLSDDCYPDPADPRSSERAAMTRDLIRSLGRGRPWMLMEQSTSAVNWRTTNVPKRPGQMRALSYQALARGSNSVLFFQWRQSTIGAEKFHSAMLPHSGTDTRIWREVQQLGAELAAMSAGGSPFSADFPVRADAAILMSWDSWWAIEQPASPTALSYVDILFSWHSAMTSLGMTVDFAHPGDDLSAYPLVVAPSLFVASVEQLSGLSRYVQSGGTLVVGYQSAVTDQDLRFHDGGYLGHLREVLGIWVEEFCPIPAVGVGAERALAGDAVGGHAIAAAWSDVLRATTADIRAQWIGDYEGTPAITVNQFGSGRAWYVGADLDSAALTALVRTIGAESGLGIPDGAYPDGVEVVIRGRYTVIVNNSDVVHDVDVAGTDILTGATASSFRLQPFGVAVVESIGS